MIRNGDEYRASLQDGRGFLYQRRVGEGCLAPTGVNGNGDHPAAAAKA